MDERPSKRARIEGLDDTNLSLPTRGHDFGSLEAHGSALVQQGDHFGIQNHYHCTQRSAHNTTGSNEDKYKILHKSLLFPRMDARVHNVSKALPDTCEWLFQHEDFKEWRVGQSISEHNGFLWIKGKPGCGKSTIMKTTLEWAQKQVRKKSSDKKVIYYFFNARAPNSLEKSTLGLYRSLLYQLLDTYPSLRSLFTNKFALKDPDDPDDSWTEKELQDFLSDMVYSEIPLSLYILIDALDEGERASDIRDMINFLIELSERALDSSSSLKLRICLSSRHYPHISIKKGLSLVVEKQIQHDQDIELYVRKKLIDQAKFMGSDSSAKEDLVTELCRKSASIFLWVVLVVRMLDEVGDHPGLVADVRTRLDEIPADLNELFAEILKKSDHGIESCIALLQWVLFAMRPLEPNELYLATEYSRSPADSMWVPCHAIVVPPEDRLCIYITDCSRGLVELTSAQPPVVQFIHETVRGYLLQSNGLASLLPALSSNLHGISHEVLKTSCVRYASKCEIPFCFQQYQNDAHRNKFSLENMKEKLRIEMPFINYSISHVFDHAEQAQTYEISQTEFLRQRMRSSHEWYGCIRLWWNVFERFKVKKYAPNTSLLYFLVEQGLTSLVTQSLKISRFVNTKCGRYGSALQAACAVGNEEIVRSLIANGADVHTTHGEHKHAILTAIYTKNFSLIHVLLENGARLSQELLRKAFFEMVARGSVQGISHLLELGADVNWVNSRNESPLKLAISSKRSSEVIDLLLQHVDFRTQLGLDEIGRKEEVLATASYKGLKQIIDLLIRDGVDVNANNDAAIRNAVLGRDVKTVRLLFENGANVNAKDKITSESLLYWASSNRDKEIVQLLIENGADVNAQGGLYGNALQAAIEVGQMAIMQILLQYNADVDAQGGYYGNALQAACDGGSEATVRILIERDADVNAQGGYYGNALQAASFRGSEAIVRLLIEKGADVNAQGGKYGSALHAVSCFKETGVIRILFESGADINLKCGKYGSALVATVSTAFYLSDKIQLLVENGADVHSRGGSNDESPLQIALRRVSTNSEPAIDSDLWRVVKILRDAGAEEPPDAWAPS